MNRYLEFILTVFGLIILSPLFLFSAIWIKLDSRGPIFYQGKRAGQNDSVFYILKFRTMVQGASKSGPPITTCNDARITRSGRFLRKTKLDELPQLLNVLKGQMAFVGPRPEDPSIVRLYSAEQKKIMQYKPGITSPASIAFRNEEATIPMDKWESIYKKQILPKKLEMDLTYMQQPGFWSDIKVILMTVGMLKKPGLK